MYEVRAAKESDRDSAVRLMWKSFEPTEDLDSLRKQDWTGYWNQPDKEDWAYVAVDQDKVIANFSFFASSNNVIRSAPIRMSGVWAVATEPQHRRQGLIRALFAEAFPTMRERGMSFSVLDPFSVPFYEKFGYALAEARSTHVFQPEHLRLVKGQSGITVRELDDPKEIANVLEVEKSMTRFGSRVFHFERSIKSLIKNSHFFIFERGSEPVGTVQFKFTSSGNHTELEIWSPKYTSPEVFQSIVELVGNYSVNMKQVTCSCDPEIPLRYYFDDIYGAKSYIGGSMMVRVVDFQKYCEAVKIPAAASDPIIIHLTDEQCSWNDGTYRLVPNGESLEIEEVDSLADVKLNALQLSKIVSGLTPATMLRGIGEINCAADVATRIESIFPEESFVCYQRF